MNRFVGYVLALVVLGGVVFAVYTYAPKGSELSTTNITETEKDGTQINAEVVYGNTDAYRIEIHYPQFGISSVDAKVKTVVDNAVVAFKDYPANPPDMASPQNELTGSFDSVYVGADVVSVALSLSEYTGGAHPNTAIIGVNVDPRTGRELTLDDALAMIGKTLPQVASESSAELEAKLGKSVFFPEGAEAKTENYSTFLVGKDNVTFVFNAYQVGPYSAGVQEVSFARKSNFTE